MISHPEKLDLPVMFGEPAQIIVNWTPQVKDRYVKVKVGKSYAIIARSDLVRSLLLLGNEEEQDELIPTKSVKIRHFEKNIVIRLQEPHAAGDMIAVTVPWDIPLSAEAAAAMNL